MLNETACYLVQMFCLFYIKNTLKLDRTMSHNHDRLNALTAQKWCQEDRWDLHASLLRHAYPWLWHIVTNLLIRYLPPVKILYKLTMTVTYCQYARLIMKQAKSTHGNQGQRKFEKDAYLALEGS